MSIISETYGFTRGPEFGGRCACCGEHALRTISVTRYLELAGIIAFVAERTIGTECTLCRAVRVGEEATQGGRIPLPLPDEPLSSLFARPAHCRRGS